MRLKQFRCLELPDYACTMLVPYMPEGVGKYHDRNSIQRGIIVVSADYITVIWDLFYFSQHRYGSVDRAKWGEVMKRINVVIINPSFLLLFILSPVSSTFALVLIFIRRDTSICFFDALGFLLAVVGFVITISRNVPLNNVLHRSEEGDEFWQQYLIEWGQWNTRRFWVSLLSGSLILLSLFFIEP